MVRRLLLFCGILSALLYAVADALAGLRCEGYSFRDQTISELGVTWTVMADPEGNEFCVEARPGA